MRYWPVSAGSGGRAHLVRDLLGLPSDLEEGARGDVLLSDLYDRDPASAGLLKRHQRIHPVRELQSARLTVSVVGSAGTYDVVQRVIYRVALHSSSQELIDSHLRSSCPPPTSPPTPQPRPLRLSLRAPSRAK